jgi:hypothetical protein
MSVHQLAKLDTVSCTGVVPLHGPLDELEVLALLVVETVLLE